MICVVYEGYGSSILTLIFITCIWLPFLHIKNSFVYIYSILMSFFCSHHHHTQNVFPNIYRHSNLRFNDLLNDNVDDGGSTIRSIDESCSICLAEFVDEDIVSQLGRCRHEFHTCCIESWLNRDQFTCPLCRSNLLGISRKRVELNQNPDEDFLPYWQW